MQDKAADDAVVIQVCTAVGKKKRDDARNVCFCGYTLCMGLRDRWDDLYLKEYVYVYGLIRIFFIVHCFHCFQPRGCYVLVYRQWHARRNLDCTGSWLWQGC